MKNKFNLKKASKNNKVFLGGTFGDSNWREELIPMLEISYFNPIVDDWNEAAQKREIKERENCDFCLYVLTPEMEGVYSVAEVVDDSNKRPEKTILCVLIEINDKTFTPAQEKSLDRVCAMVEENGAKICEDLEEVAEYLNKK